MDFTDLELRKLYENTTGSKAVGFYRPGLEYLCFTAALTLQDSNVNELDLYWQVSAIRENDKTRYAYCDGLRVPKPVDELFELDALTVEANLTVEAVAASLRPVAPPYVPPIAAPGFAPTGHDRPRAAPRVQATLPAGVKPVGGKRERIWTHADTVWEEAGKPVNLTRVLDLRKQIMRDLEKEGFNKNSVSCELGVWQKSRLQ